MDGIKEKIKCMNTRKETMKMNIHNERKNLIKIEKIPDKWEQLIKENYEFLEMKENCRVMVGEIETIPVVAVFIAQNKSHVYYQVEGKCEYYSIFKDWKANCRRGKIKSITGYIVSDLGFLPGLTCK